MRELCREPYLRTRYSLSSLYHPGMCGFECVATRGNKKCGLCLYLIHTFGPIACIKSDVGGINIYIYLFTLIPRNITSQLQCISVSAAGTSAIPVTDK